MPKDARQQIEDVRNQIREHDHRYYVLADPTVSDREYDKLLASLRKLEDSNPELITPDSPTQRVGGEPIDGFDHVRHAVPMLSIDNTYDETQLREFDGRVAKRLKEKDYEYVVDPKIDGVAISLRYEDRALKLAATRGDGTTGDDVTHTIRTIRAIPLALRGRDVPEVVEVRGEVYWPRKQFDRFNEKRNAAGEPTFANPRNATAGTLKQLDPKKISGRGLSFIAHGFGQIDPMPFDTFSQLLDAFREWGIPVNSDRKTFGDIDALIAHIHDWDAKRGELPYETDGLVVKIDSLDQRERLGATSRHPRWCIAYKYAAERVETVLLAVDWQVGKLGAVTPVAKLKPVQVAGTTVSNASLHNPVQIERLDLHEGDTVIIEKAGEIIPQVVGVVLAKRPRGAAPVSIQKTCPVCTEPTVRDKPDPGLVAFRCENRDCEDAYKVIQRVKLRETCVRCGQPVADVDELPTLRCVNPVCPAQIKARLTHFASRGAMDIEGLGEAAVDAMVTKGLLSGIADIYRLECHTETIESMTGFAPKSVSNLIEAIRASKTRPVSRLLAALNIPHVGKATAELMAAHFGTMERIAEASGEQFQEVEGVGSEMANCIRSFFDSVEGAKTWRALRDAGVRMTEPKPRRSADILTGKTVVVTGTLERFTRSEIHARIKQLGGRVGSSVSGKTDLVVVGGSPGGKADKARELGIRIVSEDAFVGEFG